MNNKIHTCLWFDGNAKEAAELYCAAIGNSRIRSESPMLVNFELAGIQVTGLNGGPRYTINPSISFTVACSSVAATNALWDRLIEGGTPLMAIDTYPWSERYGWLKDRFGMTWQITVNPEAGAAQKLTPSLLFTGPVFGRAEEAIGFYASVFGNASTGMLVHYPEGNEYAGKIMYAEFSLMQHPFIIMDGPGEHAYTFNEAVSFVVQCDTQEEIDHYWNQLTAGGAESQCGWLKDRFGVSWQIVPSMLGQLMSDPEKGPRVVNAFLKMKKFDIATLLNA